MIAKTVGKTADEAAIVPVSMVAVTLGEGALERGGKPPGTTAKQAAMLRAALIAAQENAAKKEPPTDIKSVIMMKVVKGKIPLLVTAQRANDIMNALRIAKEFNLKIILDGAAEAQVGFK